MFASRNTWCHIAKNKHIIIIVFANPVNKRTLHVFFCYWVKSPELLLHIGQQSQYTADSWRRCILFLPYIPGSRKVNNANHKQFAMIYIYM